MLDVSKLDINYVTNDAGDKTAVILTIDDFNELMEDIEDLAAVAERREESSISHEELLAELKRDGLLQN
jgi:PHD/YefM family antitoxin component YafN of YafNO toxin-antitoxin module